MAEREQDSFLDWLGRGISNFFAGPSAASTPEVRNNMYQPLTPENPMRESWAEGRAQAYRAQLSERELSQVNAALADADAALQATFARTDDDIDRLSQLSGTGSFERNNQDAPSEYVAGRYVALVKEAPEAVTEVAQQVAAVQHVQEPANPEFMRHLQIELEFLGEGYQTDRRGVVGEVDGVKGACTIQAIEAAKQLLGLEASADDQQVYHALVRHNAVLLAERDTGSSRS